MFYLLCLFVINVFGGGGGSGDLGEGDKKSLSTQALQYSTNGDTYAAASTSIEVTVNALIENTASTISSFSSDLNSEFISNSVQFSWDISDTDSDILTCKLDINNDGNTNYTIESCTSSSVQSHIYATPNSYTVKRLCWMNKTQAKKTYLQDV